MDPGATYSGRLYVWVSNRLCVSGGCRGAAHQYRECNGPDAWRGDAKPGTVRSPYTGMANDAADFFNDVFHCNERTCRPLIQILNF